MAYIGNDYNDDDLFGDILSCMRDYDLMANIQQTPYIYIKVYNRSV